MKIGRSLAGVDGVQLDDTRLRVEAARRGWSMWKVAATADIPPSNLSAYRHGHQPITLRIIARLEKALELPRGALVVDAIDSTPVKAQATITAPETTPTPDKAVEEK